MTIWNVLHSSQYIMLTYHRLVYYYYGYIPMGFAIVQAYYTYVR